MCLGPWLVFVALYINIYTRLKQVKTIQIINPTGLVVSVTSFSGLSFYDCPFMIAPTVFFNVYLLIGMTGFA
jgi:hypothetical protein